MLVYTAAERPLYFCGQIKSNQIKSKRQHYGDVSARNTTKAPNNMQNLKIQNKLKALAKRNVFSLHLKVILTIQHNTLKNCIQT